MYDTHVPVINAYLRSSPEAMARGLTFCLLTIQQQLVMVPAAMKDVDAKGDTSRYLFGSKPRGYREIQERRLELFRQLRQDDTHAVLTAGSSIYGIGIVKAAFVAQMLGHDVACLDTRNIQREGLAERAYARPYTPTKIDRYISQTRGRARELWDTWCNEVSQVGLWGGDAEAVSKVHLDCIVPADYIVPTTLQPVPFLGLSEEIPF